ncbi:dTDP-glucose 4,6-dehydratase [candidate division KSB1 bacterium]|nr:dTDP-glucose 4,6-dehydratase [candidate division KSB1 bacterium]
MKQFLITGGAGFIGSNFIRYMLDKHSDIKIINLDKLTYAGNLENLKDVESDSRYRFVKGDICDGSLVDSLVQESDVVVNFAAESHVDRSIGKPDDFIQTDIFGTFQLLEASRKHGVDRFIQISTDEVYGSIDKGLFEETDPLMPSSPYSASKTGADRLVYSYYVTYDLPILITRASNNYGPYQYPEKLISLFVTNAIEGKPLPIYGDGLNVRDWLYVADHCSAIDFVLDNGKIGEVYNVGGGNEKTNLEITDLILKTLNKPDTLKTFIKDREGHDRRYALSIQKIKELGWQPEYIFEDAIIETITWYQENREWWEKLKNGEYLDYYKSHYNQDL